MTTVFSKEVIFGEVPDGLLVGELLNLVMRLSVIVCLDWIRTGNQSQ
jgi:hypothetical protein